MPRNQMQVDTFVREIGGELDRENGPPLYLQIATKLREHMKLGTLKPGDFLPPQRELGEAWGIGEVTIRRAMQSLGKDGLIESRPRLGTVVLGGQEPATWAPDSSKPIQIGIVFADFNDGYPFLKSILAGIREQGVSVAVRLFDVPFRERSEVALADMLPLADLHGLIMMSPVNLRVVSICQTRQLPVVLLFSDVSDGFCHCVMPSYSRGVVETIGRLAEADRREIALVTAGADRFSTSRWVESFESALRAYDLPFRPERIVSSGYSEYEAAHATRDLLSSQPRPDAILYASDYMARGGLLAAREIGLQVPDELAIIGAGNVLGDSGETVRLSTIDLGLEEMGRLARQTIQDILMGAADKPMRRVSVSSFRPGETG